MEPRPGAGGRQPAPDIGVAGPRCRGGRGGQVARTRRVGCEETSSTSLLVLEEGTVVHEWYAEGSGADTLFLGASMTKSVLAHLVGRAVRNGALALSDAVTGHVPELAGTGYDGTTVLDVLTMTSGVD